MGIWADMDKAVNEASTADYVFRGWVDQRPVQGIIDWLFVPRSTVPVARISPFGLMLFPMSHDAYLPSPNYDLYLTKPELDGMLANMTRRDNRLAPSERRLMTACRAALDHPDAR